MQTFTDTRKAVVLLLKGSFNHSRSIFFKEKQDCSIQQQVQDLFL